MSLLLFILLISTTLEAVNMDFCADKDATPYLYFEDYSKETTDLLSKNEFIDGRKVLISIPLDVEILDKRLWELNLFIDCKYRGTEHLELDQTHIQP